MSKAVYSFVSYPESSDCTEIADSLYKVGWDCFCISPLHDKDIKEDGTPKKAHYHWIIGFEKNPPKPAEFIAAIKAVGGVVIQDKMFVHNAWGAVEYLTHKNAPEKYQYEEQPLFGRGWDIDRITTQNEKNEHRRYLKSLQKADDSAAIMWIISLIGADKDQINGFQPLADKVIKDKPEYFPVLLKNTYFINSYINSKLYEERLKTSQGQEIERLQRIVGQLSEENSDLARRLAFAEDSAKLYYENLTGETAPATYEMDFGE